VIAIALIIILAGLWCWFAEDHELIEEMRRGRQAEGPRRPHPGERP